ncbi:hypothetical protein BRD00_15015 [Halobacteriales archaeon QS_8_69_26]|nr:MAG: hypothetical protein BRD00_15015 [Halobacteriales archaeon QS_8_69_26]
MASIVDSVRQPEYTGENRCTPCTIVNTVIAAGLGAGLTAALYFGSVTGATVAVGAGVALFAVGMVSIWLRGYLVPKTPELTKRYFPDWVLAYFDKEPEPGVAMDAEDEDLPEEEGPDPDLDPEQALMEAGAVELCDHQDDLCLTAEFGADWNERIDRLVDEEVETEDIVAALDIGDELDEDASLTQFGEAVVLDDHGKEVGKWESTAALVADVAAAEALAERYEPWDGMNAYDRSRLLRGLRIFVEECPLCGGPMTLGQDTVESCCRSYDVVAVTCGECDARLFEEQWEEGAAEAEA